MSYTITLAETEKHRLLLVHDEHCANPRKDYDHFAGALTLPGSDYHDVPAAGELAETAKARLFGDYGRYGGHHRGRYSLDEGIAIFERWIRVFHGGVTADRWIHRDGPRVIFYATPAMVEPAGTPPERLGELVAAEADEYQAWAEGDCWGYVLEQRVTWHRAELADATDQWGRPLPERMSTWETVESCWGFIGEQWATEAALEAAGDLIPAEAVPA